MTKRLKYKVTAMFDDGLFKATDKGWKRIGDNPNPRPRHLDPRGAFALLGDGVAINSVTHPEPRRGWRRFWSRLTLRFRDIRRASVETVEISLPD
jgi:hypothetical protein